MNYTYLWNHLEYDFDGVKYANDTTKRWTPEGIYFKEDVEESEIFFKQYNNIPIGFEVYGDSIFITVPRRRYGIPSTLNYIDPETTDESPPLKPYPNVDSISRFVSVYRPRVDDCDRLWMVDTGLLEVPGNRVQLKQPEIIIFDLKTNKEILRYQLKPEVLVNGTTSGLTSITVDVTALACNDAYAYINDLATNGLIVFSLKEKDSWRFSHPTFSYDPGASNFKVGDHTIDWKDGIFSVALSDPNIKGVRTAYYHPFVATQEFSITTDILKNKNGDFDKNFKLEGVRGAWSQSGSHAYDSATRTLIFANVAQDGLLCWNIDKPLTPKNTALFVQDHRWLLYVSDLKVIKGNIWLLTNAMPKFIYSKLDPVEYNFHLFWGNLSQLIAGTVCAGNTD